MPSPSKMRLLACALIAALSPVETMTWCPPPLVERAPPLAMPPADVVAALAALAAEREVHFRTCE